MKSGAVGGRNLKVLTFNVQNLYMGPQDTTINPPTRKRERSLDAIAETLERADADVVTLQEVFSKETLEEQVLSRRRLAEKYPHIAYVKGNDKRGIQVSILSKYPMNRVVTHKDHEFPLIDGSGKRKFSRDLLRVDIDLDGDANTSQATIYTTHSKSRRTSKSGATSDTIRASEGKAIGRIVRDEMREFPGRFYAVTGDLNDGPDNQSVELLRNGDPGDSILLDSLAHLAGEERHTWPSSVSKSRNQAGGFDHILYPQEFEGQLIKSDKLRYGQSANSKTKWLSTAASDHLPVLAEFELKM